MGRGEHMKEKRGGRGSLPSRIPNPKAAWGGNGQGLEIAQDMALFLGTEKFMYPIE